MPKTSLFTPTEELAFVLDVEHAQAVVEFRKVTMKRPLTAFAAKLLARQLSIWPDPNEAAEIMIEKCWQGFKSEWVTRPRNNRGQPLRGAAALAEDLKQEITNAGLGRPEGPDHQAGEQLRLERFQLH